MIRTLRAALATVLLLAAGNALALGLGQIEVKSRINQPLLAEIPIVSTTPGELQALQARLASPETFRRVGLAPPQGVAADLRFSLGSDARGRPVIRVTTVAPVNQAVLNFLIEVDWGQGRLVREYSALVEAPRTASAALQPAIDAPVVAVPNVVQRAVVPAPQQRPAAPAPVAIEKAAAPLPPVSRSTTAPVALTTEVADEPVPSATIAVEPAPVSTAIMPPPRPAPPVSAPVEKVDVAVLAPTPARPTATAPSQYGPVRAGETLSKIASTLDRAGAYSLDQTMLALLRANPDAFLGENINLLRQGAVLRVPETGAPASIGAEEAQLVVREQMQQWRQARQPVLQPEATIASTVKASVPERRAVESKPEISAPAKVAAAKPAETAKPAAAPKAIAQPTKAPPPAQARLAIVPAAVPGKATGTRSGTNAGGEGTMLQQQLQQRDEDLAARKAEIGDLKERVAALEKLEKQQTQLLTMKDSELAAAQQRLADARKTSAAAAVTPQPEPATTQSTQSTQSAQPPQAQANTLMPWLWGGLVVLGLGLLAWLFSRRRAPNPASASRRSFDSEALAASMPGGAASLAALPVNETDAGEATAAVEAAASTPPASTPGREERDDHLRDLADLSGTPSPTAEAPTWHSDRMLKDEQAADAAVIAASAPRFVPAGDALTPELLPEPASAEQRMKLARAFLDIGDDHSAKQLLVELMDGPDPAMRTDAAKLLRELG